MSTTATRGRIDSVRAKAEEWARELIDFGHSNTLLHFKDTKSGTLDLTSAEPRALADLFGGRKVRLDRLVTSSDELKAAGIRARGLRKKALEFEEEQGVEAARMACGLLVVNPPPSRATPIRALRAPLVLRSVTFSGKSATEADLALEVVDDPDVNPVLLHCLSREFGFDIDPDEFGDKLDALLAECVEPADQVDQVHAMIAEVARRHGVSVELQNRVVVGMFSYEKLPMYEDLCASGDLLAEHEVIAAIAGVSSARGDVEAVGHGVLRLSTDNIPPHDEFLVQDADSSQQKAISAALAGRHVLIEGPPGTGKSQTIANIIAGMAAKGKRVLFVAEKRAAIEAVTERLAQVDLDGLVFDLHQQKINKRQVAQQLAESLDRASKELPLDLGELDRRLVKSRQEAVKHPAQLHELRGPWGISAYQVQAELLNMPVHAQSHIRFRGSQLRDLSSERYFALERDLQDYVDKGGLGVRRGESPWAQSEVTSEEDVVRVVAELDQLTGTTLRRNQSEMNELVGKTGLRRPADLAGWQETLELLDAVSKSVDAFGKDVFGAHLDQLRFAVADRRWRKANPESLGWSQRRALRKQVKSMSRQGITARRQLFDGLSVAVDQRRRWRDLAVNGGEPSAVLGLAEKMRNFTELRNQLAAVAMCAKIGDLERTPEPQVSVVIDNLNQDLNTLWKMPGLNKLARNLEATGLGPLLNLLAEQDVDSATARQVLRWSWLMSLYEEFKMRVPYFAQFAGQQHSRVVQEFQNADRQHVRMTANRVRYALAGRVRQVRDANPEQSKLVRDQASRKTRHMPLRKLVEKAPDVLLALRPCWAMSPLVVSKTLPPERLFDLVIFDEASQVEPHDAMTAIMRGKQLVVAGDSKQLPPSKWFGKVLAGDMDAEEDEDDTGDLRVYESILDTLRSVIPDHHMLRWHYRSRDERLIAFSNKEIYAERLVTFPGSQAESPIRLEVVDGVAVPGQDGSAAAEVDRVVELVLDHARNRPEESLGVITMGITHADRVERKLTAARRENPDLDEFFSDAAGPGRRFFIKNLERVQGDERDAIILTIGYAKSPNGRLHMKFGALTHKGGERRLNVAITRAKKRMTVVSSFSHHDMTAAASATHEGPELLRRFLEFAADADGLDKIGRAHDVELNGLESDVLRAIEGAGIAVIPQWGVSDYRIDFALAHPDQPGRMVLAVETDGERYHLADSARDRDRLRQAHLEALGWRFHRIWASDWFVDREGQTALIVERWRQAVELADRTPEPVAPAPVVVRPKPVERAARPYLPYIEKIGDLTENKLTEFCLWLLSDQRHMDRESRLDEAIRELGLKRRGKIIVERLNEAFDRAQQIHDRKGR